MVVGLGWQEYLCRAESITPLSQAERKAPALLTEPPAESHSAKHVHWDTPTCSTSYSTQESKLPTARIWEKVQINAFIWHLIWKKRFELKKKKKKKKGFYSDNYSVLCNVNEMLLNIHGSGFNQGKLEP